jgi:hypothetical protein
MQLQGNEELQELVELSDGERLRFFEEMGFTVYRDFLSRYFETK